MASTYHSTAYFDEDCVRVSQAVKTCNCSRHKLGYLKNAVKRKRKIMCPERVWRNTFLR